MSALGADGIRDGRIPAAGAAATAHVGIRRRGLPRADSRRRRDPPPLARGRGERKARQVRDGLRRARSPDASPTPRPPCVNGRRWSGARPPSGCRRCRRAAAPISPTGSSRAAGSRRRRCCFATPPSPSTRIASTTTCRTRSTTKAIPPSWCRHRCSPRCCSIMRQRAGTRATRRAFRSARWRRPTPASCCTWPEGKRGRHGSRRYRQRRATPHGSAAGTTLSATRHPRAGRPLNRRRAPQNRENPALRDQPFQQRRGAELVAVHLLQRAQAPEDLRQPLELGPEHRAAAVERPAVAVQPDHIDVGGACRDALLEDLRALVDHRVEAALEDLLVADRAPRDALARGEIVDQLLGERRGRGLATRLS